MASVVIYCRSTSIIVLSCVWMVGAALAVASPSFASQGNKTAQKSDKNQKQQQAYNPKALSEDLKDILRDLDVKDKEAGGPKAKDLADLAERALDLQARYLGEPSDGIIFNRDNANESPNGYFPNLLAGYLYWRAANLEGDPRTKRAYYQECCRRLEVNGRTYPKYNNASVSALYVDASLHSNPNPGQLIVALKALALLVNPIGKSEKAFTSAEYKNLTNQPPMPGELAAPVAGWGYEAYLHTVALLKGGPRLTITSQKLVADDENQPLVLEGFVEGYPLPVDLVAVDKNNPALILGKKLGAVTTIEVPLSVDEGMAGEATLRWKVSADAEAAIKELTGEAAPPGGSIGTVAYGRQSKPVIRVEAGYIARDAPYLRNFPYAIDKLKPNDEIFVTAGGNRVPLKPGADGRGLTPGGREIRLEPYGKTVVTFSVVRNGTPAAKDVQVLVQSELRPELRSATLQPLFPDPASPVSAIRIVLRDYKPPTELRTHGISFNTINLGDKMIVRADPVAGEPGLNEYVCLAPWLNTDGASSISFQLSAGGLLTGTAKADRAIVDKAERETLAASVAGDPLGLLATPGKLDDAAKKYVALNTDKRQDERKEYLTRFYDYATEMAPTLPDPDAEANRLSQYADVAEAIGKGDNLAQRIAEVRSRVRVVIEDAKISQVAAGVALIRFTVKGLSNNNALKRTLQGISAGRVRLLAGSALWKDDVSITEGTQTAPGSAKVALLVPAETLEGQTVSVTFEDRKSGGVAKPAASLPVPLVPADPVAPAALSAGLGAQFTRATDVKAGISANLGPGLDEIAGAAAIANAARLVEDAKKIPSEKIDRSVQKRISDAREYCNQIRSTPSVKSQADDLLGQIAQAEDTIRKAVTPVQSAYKLDAKKNVLLKGSYVRVASAAEKVTLKLLEGDLSGQQVSPGIWQFDVSGKHIKDGKLAAVASVVGLDGIDSTPLGPVAAIVAEPKLIPTLFSVQFDGNNGWVIDPASGKNENAIKITFSTKIARWASWQLKPREEGLPSYPAQPSIVPIPESGDLDVKIDPKTLAHGHYKVVMSLSADENKADDSWQPVTVDKVVPVVGRGVAFLAGIESYDGVRDLHQACKDVDKLRSALIRDFGYDEENIVFIKGMRVGNAYDVESSWGDGADALDMNPKIVKPGTYTYTARRVTAGALSGAFKNFLDLVKDRSANHVVVFYSGHGTRYKDVDRFKCAESLQDKSDTYVRWNQWIQDIYKNASAAHPMTIVTLIDACRDADSKIIKIEYQQPPDYVKWIPIYSCRPGQQSGENSEKPSEAIDDGRDGPGPFQNGFFTHALLAALKAGKGVTIGSALATAADTLADVMTKAKDKRAFGYPESQTIYLSGGDPADFKIPLFNAGLGDNK